MLSTWRVVLMRRPLSMMRTDTGPCGSGGRSLCTHPRFFCTIAVAAPPARGTIRENARGILRFISNGVVCSCCALYQTMGCFRNICHNSTAGGSLSNTSATSVCYTVSRRGHQLLRSRGVRAAPGRANAAALLSRRGQRRALVGARPPARHLQAGHTTRWCDEPGLLPPPILSSKVGTTGA